MSYLVRSGVLQGYRELATDLSVDPDELFSRSNLSSEQIKDEDSVVAMESVVNLLELTAEESQCKHVGLLLARKQTTNFMGLVGILMESSPNLDWALKEAMRYFRIHAEGIEWDLTSRDGLAIWSVNFDLPASIPHQQGKELSIGQAFHVVRSLSHNRWKPSRICFRHDMADEIWFYEQYFQVPIEFNAECDGFLFASDELNLQVSDQDTRVYNALSQYAEILTGDYQEDLPTKVKGLIRKLLPESQCNIDVIASLLACDKRTLQRNLKRDGSSYQSLLDEVRHNVAAEYLEHSSLTLAYISSMLGYDEISSFSRSFKKHFGTSPSDWRKKKLQEKEGKSGD